MNEPKEFAVTIDTEAVPGEMRSGGMPATNPTPTKTWSELIRCPECKTDEWAMVEHEHEMPWPLYVHTCQNCGHVILESEWNKVSESIKHPTLDALLPGQPESYMSVARRGEPRVVLEASQEEAKAMQGRIEGLEMELAEAKRQRGYAAGLKDGYELRATTAEAREGRLRGVLEKALPIVEAEADMRGAADPGAGRGESYWTEMSDLQTAIIDALMPDKSITPEKEPTQ